MRAQDKTLHELPDTFGFLLFLPITKIFSLSQISSAEHPHLPSFLKPKLSLLSIELAVMASASTPMTKDVGQQLVQFIRTGLLFTIATFYCSPSFVWV